MPAQIFVEDRLTEPYELLARRALGLPVTLRDRSQLRASRVDLEDLTSLTGLLDLSRRSIQSGYECILFVMDEEGPESRERPAKLAAFRQAFRDLCEYLARLGSEDVLRRARVVRVICRRCLEGWLVADPQAVVSAFRGAKGVDWQPQAQRTDEWHPRQASEAIARIANEVGRRTGRRDLAILNARSAKSHGKDIAAHLDPARARAFNSSLAYFFDMVDGRRSGCDHPFPEPDRP